MDPNANLNAQKSYVLEINRIVDNVNTDGTYKPGQQQRLAELAYRLAEHVEALDEWIQRGGFLPRVWRRDDDVECEFCNMDIAAAGIASHRATCKG